MNRDSIFVFGSNLSGRHGKGAALHAKDHYGAQYGVGVGITGSAYGIPTKGADKCLTVLPLDSIKGYVDDFLVFAATNPEMKFKVTKIGCGLAGYKEEQIIPMFRHAPPNCELPDGWRQE